MENFYVTYDATDPQQLKVGLSSTEADPVESLLIIFLMCMFGSMIALFIGIVVCLLVRKRRDDRLAKAKTYFDSLKTDNDDPEEKFME